MSQQTEVLAPVFVTGQESEFLPLDTAALPLYSIMLYQPIGADREVKLRAATYEEAVGKVLMDNPKLCYNGIRSYKAVEGAHASSLDDEIMVPVKVDGGTKLMMLAGADTPTYLVVFKEPIETDDPNGYRMALGAITIEEAVGCALVANPDRCYDDITDHMEV